jgi:hypothetical protein
VEAYAQYAPIGVWKADGPASRTSTTVANPWPTGAFNLPRHAVLQGISLTDPLGTWPDSYKKVQGSNTNNGAVVNGAQWINSDSDDQLGLTTYTVGPNGTSGDGPNAPYEAYGQRSKVCPRGKPNGDRSRYNYPPAADGIVPRRVTRIWSANRVISTVEGKINSCDEITGEIKGVSFDTRIGGCLRASDGGEVACSTAVVDFLDDTGAPNEVKSSTFVMRRVADAITCEQVRSTLPTP